MSDWVRNKVICSVDVAKTILTKSDEMWKVKLEGVVEKAGNLSKEEVEKIKKDFYNTWSVESWKNIWNSQTNNVVIDEKQDIAVLDFDTQYVPPKLIMCKLLIESPKKRLIWHYEFDDNIRTINNNKGNPKKIIRTQDLQEYDDLLNEYEKQSEQELEME